MNIVRYASLVVLAAVSVSGCASGSSVETKKSDKAVVDKAADACAGVGEKYPSLKGEEINVGSSPGPAYYDTVDETDPNKVIGLEPDLVAAVAKCAGFTFTYQKQDFNGLIPALGSGRIDLITSGMYATPERAQEVNFVTYMKAAEAAVVQSGNPKNVTGLDTMCGTTVAQQVGTVEVEIAAKASKECVAQGKPKIKFIDFTNSNQLTSALTGKRADIFLTDSGVAAYLAKQFEGKLEKGFDIVSDFKFGIAVSKDNEDLLNAVYDSLTALHEEGDLTKVAEQWGFSAEQVIAPEIVTE